MLGIFYILQQIRSLCFFNDAKHSQSGILLCNFNLFVVCVFLRSSLGIFYVCNRSIFRLYFNRYYIWQCSLCKYVQFPYWFDWVFKILQGKCAFDIHFDNYSKNNWMLLFDCMMHTYSVRWWFSSSYHFYPWLVGRLKWQGTARNWIRYAYTIFTIWTCTYNFKLTEWIVIRWNSAFRFNAISNYYGFDLRKGGN